MRPRILPPGDHPNSDTPSASRPGQRLRLSHLGHAKQGTSEQRGAPKLRRGAQNPGNNKHLDFVQRS